MTNLDADTTPASERMWQSSPTAPASADEALHQAGPDDDSAARNLANWLRDQYRGGVHPGQGARFAGSN